MKLIKGKIYLVKYNGSNEYALYIGCDEFQLFGKSEKFDIDVFEFINETPIL